MIYRAQLLHGVAFDDDDPNARRGHTMTTLHERVSF